MVGSHTMFSEQARGPDGRIQDGSGAVYSPMARVKTGFVSPNETEFHFVAHTMQPDQNNFPPHTAWIHLHFSNVRVLESPDGVQIHGKWIGRAPRRAAGDRCAGFRSDGRSGRWGRATSAVRPRLLFPVA